MNDQTVSDLPTANTLKNALRVSLEILKKDFESLERFMEELAPNGVPTAIPLSGDDVRDLVNATLEIHDAANNIEFEASKIKQTLQRVRG